MQPWEIKYIFQTKASGKVRGEHIKAIRHGQTAGRGESRVDGFRAGLTLAPPWLHPAPGAAVAPGSSSAHVKALGMEIQVS